jgi:putative heme iron utilization protein
LKFLKQIPDAEDAKVAQKSQKNAQFTEVIRALHQRAKKDHQSTRLDRVFEPIYRLN